MKEDLKALSATDHLVSPPAFSRKVLSAGCRNDFDLERWMTGVGYKVYEIPRVSYAVR